MNKIVSSLVAVSLIVGTAHTFEFKYEPNLNKVEWGNEAYEYGFKIGYCNGVFTYDADKEYQKITGYPVLTQEYAEELGIDKKIRDVCDKAIFGDNKEHFMKELAKNHDKNKVYTKGLGDGFKFSFALLREKEID